MDGEFEMKGRGSPLLLMTQRSYSTNTQKMNFRNLMRFPKVGKDNDTKNGRLGCKVEREKCIVTGSVVSNINN